VPRVARVRTSLRRRKLRLRPFFAAAAALPRARRPSAVAVASPRARLSSTAALALLPVHLPSTAAAAALRARLRSMAPPAPQRLAGSTAVGDTREASMVAADSTAAVAAGAAAVTDRETRNIDVGG